MSKLSQVDLRWSIERQRLLASCGALTLVATTVTGAAPATTGCAKTVELPLRSKLLLLVPLHEPALLLARSLSSERRRVPLRSDC